MKKDLSTCIDDHVGCFGGFEMDDAICTHHCALRLRCCIEREQNTRMEILEDLVSAEGFYVKIH